MHTHKAYFAHILCIYVYIKSMEIIVVIGCFYSTLDNVVAFDLKSHRSWKIIFLPPR